MTKPLFKNFLLNNDFRVRLEKLPNTMFHVTNVTIPEVALGSSQQPAMFNTIHQPGDELNFGQIMMTFVVDDNMDNYKEVYAWITAIGLLKSSKDYATLLEKERSSWWKKEKVSDMSLVINSSYSNPKITMVFKNCWPSALALIVPFTSEDADAVAVKAQVSFQFDYFEFI